MQQQQNPDSESISLSKAAQYLLEECRMVLPGMQALFGFQLIAVFSQTFSEKLSHREQLLHLLALALVSVAVALVMTPAAIHRRTGSLRVTKKFIQSSARLLLWSMFPLLTGICLDFYLISRIITKSVPLALLFAFIIFGLFVLLWFVFPRLSFRKQEES
jgi:DMSO reductase anchor subunit